PAIVFGREPAARRRVVSGERAQLAAGALVAAGGPRGAPPADAHAQRARPCAAHAPTGTEVAAAGVGCATRRTIGRGVTKRSTRLPAMRSCSARLSRRSAVIRKAEPQGASDRPDAR